MLFGLLGREKESAPVGGLKSARRVRPEAERLEGRVVPAAMRNLAGLTANRLPAGDDPTSGAANLGFVANFFGVKASQVFVSNNGIVTLQQADPTSTPDGLSGPQAEPIIAPFWADVDTSKGGGVVTYGTDTLNGHKVFGVDWTNVDYFDATLPSHNSKSNSFQLLLIDRSDTGAGNFDIEFNYNSISWESGDASGGLNGRGGQSAEAGYSLGTGAAGTFGELSGSGVNGALLDYGSQPLVGHSLAANTPGRYHFFVRNGVVTQAPSLNQGLEVTKSVSTFRPYTYVYNPPDHSYRGNLTVVVNQLPSLPMTDAALDEVSQAGGTLSGSTRLTIVYQHLPAGVTLLNASGYTASGAPYIDAGAVSFRVGATVRVPVRFAVRGRVTSLDQMPGTVVRVFAGPFNPANE
ncbi:MAG TPA: nidogen-like domain-containing protein [Gemmataceae bacterium]|nr:nidogen-like domain-containing protein [Gemmataceae bacterium]